MPTHDIETPIILFVTDTVTGKTTELKKLDSVEFSTISSDLEDLEDVPERYIFNPSEFTCSFTMYKWDYYALRHMMFPNNWRRMHGLRAARRRRKKHEKRSC